VLRSISTPSEDLGDKAVEVTIRGHIAAWPYEGRSFIGTYDPASHTGSVNFRQSVNPEPNRGALIDHQVVDLAHPFVMTLVKGMPTATTARLVGDFAPLQGRVRAHSAGLAAENQFHIICNVQVMTLIG
jgi:hypothetical protein